MKTDRELADALVALGIGEAYDFRDGEFHYTHLMPPIAHEAHTFVRSWDVAGACMERLFEKGSIKYLGHDTTDTFLCTVKAGWGVNAPVLHALNESLPRAICEAYVEAMNDE